MESFKKACDLYVQDIDRDPELAEVYREAYPDIPAGSWKGFEAVGRDALVPQLLWAEDPGPRALARMPKHVQLKHLDAPVEMLTGKGEVLMVNVRGMSQAQARQVFNRNHVRSLGEQRAWLEEHQPAHDEPEALPYEVRSGKLVVLRPVTFTRAQLQKLLMEV